MPAALEALASACDPAQRRDAYWRLDNHIVLQGTLYESARAAAPYILDVLLSSTSDDLRVAAYDLLIEIARGVPDPNVAAAGDLRGDCRAVIASGRAAYARDLRCSRDGAVRRRALDLITSLDDDPEGLRALLDEIDPGDDDELAWLLARARAEA